MAKTAQPRRRPGRPPAGRNGERSSEYRPLSVRIPTSARRRLDALRIALNRPAWDILTDAIDQYAERTASDRPELRPMLTAVSRAEKRRPAAR